MLLTVTERVLVMGLLPRQGTIIDMNNAQNVRNAVQFSQEELDGLKIVQTDKGMEWDPDVANEIGAKDVVVGVSGAELIKTTLKKLSDGANLPIDAISLYKKFVDGNLTVRDEAGKIVRDVVPEVILLEEQKQNMKERSSQQYGKATETAEVTEDMHEALKEKVKELDEQTEPWSDQAEQDKIIE